MQLSLWAHNPSDDPPKYIKNHSATAWLRLSLSQILQVLSVNVFEQVPLAELVAKTASQNETFDLRNQLVFNMF
jgi:hypothetical protein